MTYQSATNNFFHFVSFNSFPIRATLALALLIGSCQAVIASPTSSYVPSKAKVTTLKTAKVQKIKKTVTAKPIPVKPKSQGNSSATSSAIFGQTEVDQNKYIAVAVPHDAGHRYQLVILEQISPKKACWNESETLSTTVVKPLLLNFNFTGICGRSTDSNGYSIRMAGQDLAGQYDIDIVRRGQTLVLIGTKFRDRYAPAIEIGKTSGFSNDLLKINLEPGWRFSKRTYEGKVLGHVYLTNDRFADRGN